MHNSNYFTENEDIQFHLKHSADRQKIYKWTPEVYRESVGAGNFTEYWDALDQAMETYGQICGTLVAKGARTVDKEGFYQVDGKYEISPTLQKNIDALKEFGLPSLGIHPRYGGLGFPFLYAMVGFEIINRACPSTGINLCWYSNIAHVIDLHASEDLKNEYIPKLATGEFSGSMALTEADAGSDLGAIRTYGEKADDGSWRLYGSKRFISNGTSEVSLVLAKNEKGSKGLKALSLFICPRDYAGKENIKVTKLEEKIGLHGSATAELQFDGAKAFLIGTEGEGFKYMSGLMNEARLGVSFQGLGCLEATFELATRYAHERVTMGKPIAEHPLIAEMLEDMEFDSRALRSLAMKAASALSLIDLGSEYAKGERISEEERKKVEKEVKTLSKKLRHWTPLLKYTSAEKTFHHARNTLQILGGYGYTTEYDAEFWVRESLIYAVYEGTSQIQALMATKDRIKDISKNIVEFLKEGFRLKAHYFTLHDPVEKAHAKIQSTEHACFRHILMELIKVNTKGKLSSTKDASRFLLETFQKGLPEFTHFEPALTHAERLAQIMSDEALLASLIEDTKVDPGRRRLAEGFAKKAVPRAQYLRALIEA